MLFGTVCPIYPVICHKFKFFVFSLNFISPYFILMILNIAIVFVFIFLILCLYCPLLLPLCSFISILFYLFQHTAIHHILSLFQYQCSPIRHAFCLLTAFMINFMPKRQPGIHVCLVCIFLQRQQSNLYLWNIYGYS